MTDHHARCDDTLQEAELAVANRQLRVAAARSELQATKAEVKAHGKAAARLASVGEQVTSVRTHYARKMRETDSALRAERATTRRLQCELHNVQGRLSEREQVIEDLRIEMASLRSRYSCCMGSSGDIQPASCGSSTGGVSQQLHKGGGTMGPQWTPLGGSTAAPHRRRPMFIMSNQDEHPPLIPPADDSPHSPHVSGSVEVQPQWRAELLSRRVAAQRQAEMATLSTQHAHQLREARASVQAAYRLTQAARTPSLRHGYYSSASMG